jgi:hypothetical protein
MASRNGFWSSRKEEKNSGPVEKPRKRRRPLGFMPLEPRIMYDGAAAATAHHHHPDITAAVGQPTNGGPVELQGTGKAGATVNLYADGGSTIVGSGKVGSDGTFDITTSATFVDGVHALTAKETFGGKWTSTASTAFSVNVDPNAPVITAVAAQPVNGGAAELKGTGEAGETVNLYADGGTTIVGTGTVGSDGSFDIKTTATFTDGVHTFTATETNSANLTSAASTAFSVNVDPNAPVITAQVGQPVNGGTVELQGTGEAGERVNLYVDGGTTLVGTGRVGSDGTFDITTMATLADGVHAFTATETRSANLTSAASTAFAVDVDPNAPVITALAGQPSNGTFELKGSGEAGATVNLYADGGTTIVGTGTVGSDGLFDITTTALPDGLHTFTATATDSTNLASTASAAFDPSAPVITAVVGQPANGGTVELQGTGLAGATINLYADGGTTIVGTGTVGSGGTFDITTTVTLPEGVHTLTATATDSANRTSAALMAFAVTIDPNAPVITAVGQPSNGGTVELQGTGEAGATINLYADGGTTIVGTGTVSSSGTFDITTTATFSGSNHTFTATATDSANLTSASSTPASSASNNSVSTVVFIDGQVPDLQDLVNGVAPGEQVFVLDPTKDGLQQIATILAINGFDNLSAISIVGHGAEGEFTIGSTDLTDNSLASEASVLRTIGQSLKPGGDILLYGCDTAQGTAGQQFIADLSALAGGANVAASTQEIGTLQGTNGTFENWSLDASTGPIDASVPFTAVALASYEGLLANPVLTASITTTLTVDADHDGGISPGDTVTSTVTITNNSGVTANGATLSETPSGLTLGSVVITPIAVNDTYSVVGNTQLTVNAANGVLANDIDFNNDTPAGSTPTMTAISATNVVGGSVTLNLDGSFTFTPTIGFSGQASFQYTAHDAAAGNSDKTATVTLNVSAPVWYVNSANTGSQDGSSAHQFTTIQAALAAAANFNHGAGSTILVENTTTTATTTYSGSPITLASGEQLIGVGSNGFNPTFSVASASAAVTLGSGNTISGINIVNTSTGDGIESSGTIGTFTMSNVGVTTKSGTGIALTGGGTVDAIGSGNTINASTGTALDIENTNIGSGNVIFKSISSGTGGSAANDGIILINTGTSGGLIVTGDGTSASTAFGGNGSGGTIEGKTGDGSTATGIGIFLENTSNVSLDDMNLSSFGNFAIRGLNVTNFTFQNSNITGQSGQNLTAGGKPTYEGTIAFGNDSSVAGGAVNGLNGAATITNSNIGFGLTDVLYIYDNSGALNRLTLTGNTFGGINDVQNAFGANEVFIEADGASTVDATVTGNTLTSSAGDGFFADVLGAAGMDLVFDNNTVGNSATLPLQGSVSVELSDDSTRAVTYDISNDIITHAVSAGILAVLSGSGTQMSGTINDDTIGSSNATGSGSQFDGIDVKIEHGSGISTTAITNNFIYHFGEDGINLLADNGGSTLNATVTGNQILDPDGNFPFAGVELDSGALGSDSNTINMTLGNVSTASGLKNTFTFNTTLADSDGYTPVFLQTLGTAKIRVSQAGSGSGSADGVVEDDNIFTTPGSGEVADSQAGGAISETSGATPTPSSAPMLSALTLPSTAAEGSTLTATAVHADDPNAVISYQWQELFGGVYANIAGATSLQFPSLTEAYVGATLRLVATSTDGDGHGLTVTSNSVTVTDNLTFTTPTISGTAEVGDVLAVSTPTADNSDATFAYQWQRGGQNISGATGQDYRLTTADLNATIDVIVTASDTHGGKTPVTVTDSTLVAAFTPPTLSNLSLGTLAPGQAVTASWQATVNTPPAGLISNPTYTGSVTANSFAPVDVDATVTLDTLTLSVEIFADSNGDGVLDNGESGISGVSLSVFAADDLTKALNTVAITTDINGLYSFTGLAAGSYVVQIDTLPTGYSNASAAVFDPNNYISGQNAGNPLALGVIDTKPITIAYDKPHPPGATTYATGDDITNTLDIGLVKGLTIGGANTTVSFYENGSALPIDQSLTVSDPAGANITSAMVTIADTDTGTPTFVPGDVLSFTPQFGITGSYNTATGVLTLSAPSGGATAAQYQSVLDSITYSFVGDPTFGGSPAVSGTEHVRTVSYTVKDQTGLTGQAANTVNTYAPPVISLGVTTATFTQGSSPVALDNTRINIFDPNLLDPNNPLVPALFSATVALTNAQSGDALSETLTDPHIGVTLNANNTALTLTALNGTVTAQAFIQALEDVQFSATGTGFSSADLASRSVTWTVDDNAGSKSNPSAAVTSTVTIQHTDNPPVLNFGTGSNPVTTEPAAVVLDSAVTVSDIELNALNDYSGASLTIARDGGASTQDVFAFSTGVGSGASFTVVGNTLQTGGETLATFTSAGGILQINFTGTGIATTSLVDNVMQHITYADQSTLSENVTLQWTFSDGNGNGAQGFGGAKTATGTTMVDVTVSNQAPVVTVPTTTQQDTENTPLTFSIANGNAISISDTSIGNGTDTVTLTVADGTLSLGSTSGLTSFTNDSATVTLTGTIKSINADLDGLTYNPNAGSFSPDTLSVTASDPGTNLTSATGIVNITVAASTSSLAATQTTTTNTDGDVAPGDTVTTTVAVNNTGGSDASSVSLSETQDGLTPTGPVTVSDSYTLTGNTPITIDAAHGVLANDVDLNGLALTATLVANSVTNGSVTLDANGDGGFTFTPNAGFTGTASFQYTATDGSPNEVTGTVTLTVTNPIFYVNNSPIAGTPDGSFDHPYTTIGAAIDAAYTFNKGVGDTIFVYNSGITYSESGITLLGSGEELLGSGSSLSEVNGMSLGSSGNPTFSVSSGNAVTLDGANETISGINIADSFGTAITLGTNDTLSNINIDTSAGTGDGIENNGAIGALTMSNIVVTTGSGTGIALVGGSSSGTDAADVVDITGSGNTVSSSIGTALDVEHTNIGSGNLIFRSISAGNATTASTADGIILDTTGLGGGLIVTGDAAHGAGSGGTIQNMTGTAGSTTNGIGIYLHSTANVSLSDMQLNDFGNYAILGDGVTNFAFDHSTISAATPNLNGTTLTEGAVSFSNLSGSADITNSNIGAGYGFDLSIDNTSGTLNRLTITGNTFGGTATAGANDVLVKADMGASAIDATVTGNTFNASAGDGFSAQALGSANMDLVFDDNPAVSNSGSVGVQLSDASKGTVTYDISGNIITNAGSAAISAVLTGSGTMNGTINGNTIGVSGGTTGTGSPTGILVEAYGAGIHTTAITNNMIYDFSTQAILVDASQGSGTLNATVTGNQITDADTANADLKVLGGAGTLNIVIGNADNTTSLQNNFGGTNVVDLEQGSGSFNLFNAGAPSADTVAGVIQADNTPSGLKVTTVNSITLATTGTPATPSGEPTLTAATISTTAPEEGVPLTVTAFAVGDSNTSSITYQWQESFGAGYVNVGAAISNPTSLSSLSYTPTEADVDATLRLVATSTDSTGVGTQAIVTETATVADNLTLTTPTISGNAVVGQVLTATPAIADNPDATIKYQWEEDTGSGFAPISGATGLSYRPTAAGALELVVSAIDSHGRTVSETVPAGTVAAFTQPTLSTGFPLQLGTLPAGDAVTISWESTVDTTTNSSLSNHGTVSTNSVTVDTNTVVTRVDQPPANTVPGPQTTLENQSLAITGLSVADQDGDPASADIKVTLSVNNGSLAINATVIGGLGVNDISYNNASHSSVTLGGSQDAIDATLAAANGVVYAPANNSTASDTLTMTSSDDGQVGVPSAPVAITVIPVNQAPTGTSEEIAVSPTGSRITASDFGFSDIDGDSLKAVEISSLPTAGTLTDNGVAVAVGQFVSLLDINNVGNGNNLGLVFTPAPGATPGKDYATFTFQVQDSGTTANGGVNLEKTPSTMTIDISTLPIITNTNNTVLFFQSAGSPVAVDGGATTGIRVSDPITNSTLESATVTLTDPETGDALSFSNPNVSLSNTSEGDITTSGPATGNTLVLISQSGNATLSEWNAALQAVTYSSSSVDPTVGGKDTTRTVTWSVTDNSVLTSANATSTIDVIGIPTISVTQNPVTFSQNGGAVAVDGAVPPGSGIAVFDPNGADIASATVSVGFGPGLTAVAGDTLSFSNPNVSLSNALEGDITVRTSTGNTLVLISQSGKANLTEWQDALEAVQYNSTSADPTVGGTEAARNVTWSVTDADNQTSALATSTFNVHGIPVIAGTSNTVTFTENGSAVPVDGTSPGGITVIDPNNVDITRATATLSGTFSNNDLLDIPAAVVGSTISGTKITFVGYDSNTHVLTLSGSDSAADYQIALREVTYSFTGDPTNGGTDHSRTVTWSVTDSDNQTSADATSTIDVLGFPTISVTSTPVSYYQNGNAVQADGTGPTITISDPNSVPIASATVTVLSSVSGDMLSFNNTSSLANSFFEGNITVDPSSTANELVLVSQGDTASALQWQNALEAVTYTFASTASGDPTNGGHDTTRTVTWSVIDADNQQSLTSPNTTIDVFAQPVVTIPPGTDLTFTIGGGPANVLPTDSLGHPVITLTDFNGPNLQGATVTISDAQPDDILSYTYTGPITISGASSTTLTLKGDFSIAEYIKALGDVQFSTNSTDFGARTITWTVNDNAGGQTNSSAPAISNVTFDSVSVTGTAQEGQVLTATPAGDPSAIETYQWQRSSDGVHWTSISGATNSSYTAVEADEGNHLRVEAIFTDNGLTVVQTKVDSGPTAIVINNPPAFTAVVGQPVNDGTVELQGTGENGETVNIYADGNTTTIVGTGIVSSNGTFDIITTAPFAEGPHTFTATETNEAVHLVSTFSTPVFPVIVDPTPPEITAVVGQPLNGDTIELQGTGEVGDTVVLFAGGTKVGTGTVGAAGTFDITTTATFAAGAYTFTSTETDALHLTSPLSTPAFAVTVIPPTVIAGADPTYNAAPGSSVVLDPSIGAYDGINLAGATVSIASGFQFGDTLSANTAGTNIHESYANGILTLTGSDTVAHYDSVLASVTFSSSQSQSGQATFDWQITDQSNLKSAVAHSTVTIIGNPVAPPLHNQASSPIPDSPGHSQFGDFSALVINANLQGEGNFFNDFSPFHPDAYVVHVDVHATVADNGAITFNLPLSQLDAALDGDVVSVTATLADGRPLPAWLQFDGDTGQFAGLLPENNATGSIGPDGGNSTGQPLDTHVPSTLLQSITIEVVARDSKGNLAITDFTIDISELKRHSSELKRHGSEQHGWNLSPGDGFVEPFATNLRGRDHAIDLAPGSHRELAPLHAMDRVLWHDVATFDIGRVHGDHGNDHPPAGRAGLSDQIKTLGWHGATAERNALLDSLRLGVAGWR